MATRKKSIVGEFIDDLAKQKPIPMESKKKLPKPRAKKVETPRMSPQQMAQQLIDNDPEIRQRKWDARVVEMRAEAIKRADACEDGWVELTLEPEDGKEGQEGQEEITVKVARIPLERWARHARDHRKDEWPGNVCPSGAKMQMDDRNHSDWWISNSLGIPLDYAYERNHRSSWRETLDPSDEDYVAPDPQRLKWASLAKRMDSASWMFRLESDRDRVKNSIFLVSSKKKIEGYVMHVRTPEDILKFVDQAQSWAKSTFPQHFVAVIPNCSIDYDLVIRFAGAIITEIGSAAAHVVKIAREDKVPVIMCPTAFKEYWDGERIAIENKSIRVRH